MTLISKEEERCISRDLDKLNQVVDDNVTQWHVSFDTKDQQRHIVVSVQDSDQPRLKEILADSVARQLRLLKQDLRVAGISTVGSYEVKADVEATDEVHTVYTPENSPRSTSDTGSSPCFSFSPRSIDLENDMPLDICVGAENSLYPPVVSTIGMMWLPMFPMVFAPPPCCCIHKSLASVQNGVCTVCNGTASSSSTPLVQSSMGTDDDSITVLSASTAVTSDVPLDTFQSEVLTTIAELLFAGGRLETCAIKHKVQSNNLHQIIFVVPASKLTTRDKQLISREVQVLLGGRMVSFKVMIDPKDAFLAKHGGSFAKSKGLGYVDLKCNEDICCSYRIMVSSTDPRKQQPPRGPFYHNFAESSVTDQSTHWNFKASVDEMSKTFIIAVEIGLMNEGADPVYQ